MTRPSKTIRGLSHIHHPSMIDITNTLNSPPTWMFTTRARSAVASVAISVSYLVIFSGCGLTTTQSLPPPRQTSTSMNRLPHISLDPQLTQRLHMFDHDQAGLNTTREHAYQDQHQDQPHDNELTPQLFTCLSALSPPNRSSVLDTSSHSDPTYASHSAQLRGPAANVCATLLSRPAEHAKSIWLSKEWLVIDLHESVHLSLMIPAAQRTAQLMSGSQAQWTLDVTLLRLPRALDRPHPDQFKDQRALQSAVGVPPPLHAWAQARLERASLSSWTPMGVEHRALRLPTQATLEQLPLPRVGQAVTMRLSRPAPEIKRGAWALHLPLWLNSAALRRSLMLSVPKGAYVSRFGPPPQLRHTIAHKERLLWVRRLIPTGEGEVVYLSATESWRALNRWLWEQLYQQYSAYQRSLNRYLSAPPLDRFLSPVSNHELHRWVIDHFDYEPHSERPYNPLPPLELFKRRAGDCKDLSLLSLSLLEFQGRRPFFALTSTRPLPKQALEIPSIGWFDHVLLWLPDPQTYELAKLSARSEQRLLDAPLARYQWFDPTSPRMTPQMRSRFAYILLSPDLGLWVPIRDLR